MPVNYFKINLNSRHAIEPTRESVTCDFKSRFFVAFRNNLTTYRGIATLKVLHILSVIVVIVSLDLFFLPRYIYILISRIQ